MAARARRSAVIVASVPEEVMRIMSTAGMRAATSAARSTSPAVGAPKLVPRASALATAETTAGWACPWMSGPHEHT